MPKPEKKNTKTIQSISITQKKTQTTNKNNFKLFILVNTTKSCFPGKIFDIADQIVMSHCCSFCDRRWHSPRRLYRSLRLHVPIPATFRTFPVVSDAIAFSERTAVDCVPLELIASGAGQ